MAKNKGDQFYFDNMSKAADYACQAAAYLESCLKDFHSENIKSMLDTMHTYEHAGDALKHEMLEALAHAFVTPIDREDLALISQILDDVTDGIEEVLQTIYMYRVTSIPTDALTFAGKLVDSCQKMKATLAEFPRFKKSDKLHSMIVELNHEEDQCDVLYMESMWRLGDADMSLNDLYAWRIIYGKMEKCADTTEHVGDQIDMVVMKNT